MGWMAGVGAAGLMYNMYSDRKNRQQQKELSQPLPTYLRYAWNPMQRQMYNWMAPMMGGMYGAEPGTIPSAANVASQTDIAAFENPPEQRQFGGPVGQAPYLVGEAGPEIFVPEQRGQVIPLTPRQEGGQVVPPEEGFMNPTAMPTPGLATTGTEETFDPATVQGATAYQGIAPTGNWYGNLDPNVRAGIEQPYMRGMEMLENRMQGRGTLGAQRTGMSGAAADVMGRYMQQAAPSMAMTGWGMIAPGAMQAQRLSAGSQAQFAGAQNQASMQAAGFQGQSGLMAQGAGDQAAMLQQQQTWQGSMLPYQMLPGMMPYMMPEGISGSADIYFPGETPPPPPPPPLPQQQYTTPPGATYPQLYGGSAGSER